MFVCAVPETSGLRADAERNRQRLLDAAAELFAERGFDVSLPEIAAHAGVGVATAYRRFPDRDVLIGELFDQRLGSVVTAARAGLDAEDPWDGFVLAVEGVLERLSGNMGLKQLLMGEVDTSDRVARMRAELLPIMTEVMDRAKAAGALREDLAPTDIPIMNFMISSAMQLTQEDAPDHWRRMFAILLDGLRAQRDAPTPLPAAPLAAEQIPKIMGSPAVYRPASST